jgi:hypothetical protein
VVGGKGYGVAERGDVEVAHGGGAGGAGEEGVGELLEVEDAARGAELSEIRGEKRWEGGAVGLAIRVEEAFFQGMEVLLQIDLRHDGLTDVHFRGRVSREIFSGREKRFWGGVLGKTECSGG